MNTSTYQQKLQDLIDRDEIRQCVVRAARGIDRYDEQLVLDSYHPEARDDHGEFIGSPKDFYAYCQVRQTEAWNYNMHCLLNQTIDLDGDTAHSELYYIAFLRRKEGTATDVCYGRYLDRLEKREDGVWRIAARVTSMEFRGELHGDTPPPGAFIPATPGRSDISYARPLEVEREDRPWVPGS